MRRQLAGTVCVLLAAWPLLHVRAANGWSVQDTVRMALERNPDLKTAELRVAQAEARAEAARAAFLPWLGADLSCLRADAPATYLFKTIDSRELPQMVDFNDPGIVDNVEAGMTLRYTLWDAGRRRLARSSARHGVRAETAGHDAAANELIGAVIQAYFAVLEAGEYVTVADRSLQTVRSQLRDVRVRHENGGALKADVLALEVRDSRAQERLISARNALDLSHAGLRQMLDLGPEEDVTLSGEEWRPADLPATLPECLETATANRPELRALEARIGAARAGAGLARRQVWPTLDAIGRYWADDDGTDFDAPRANWMVGATLTWSLFEGGRRRAQWREAGAAMDEVQTRQRGLQRSIEVQVHRAFLSLQEARSRYDVAKANVARAEESLRLVQQLFEGGAATVTRYLQGEQDRTEALFGEIRGRFDIKRRSAGLGHALGLCWKCAPK